jgi:hypothetical protein
LGALILLIISGLISGYKDLASIARWGRSLGVEDLQRLGFKQVAPCHATLSNILRQLGSEALQNQLNQWIISSSGAKTGEHLSLDGKTLCGSRTGPTGNAQVHLLSLFCVQTGLVVKDTPEKEGENEISCALRLLASVSLRGKIVTGDAIFAQKKYAA